jgi:hypothetical protein
MIHEIEEGARGLDRVNLTDLGAEL